MKKGLIWIVVLMIAGNSICMPIYAKEAFVEERVIYKETINLGEGLTEEIVITEIFQAQTKISTKTKKAKKTSSIKSEGKVVIRSTLYGTFTYDNKTSKCTASSVESMPINKTWKIKSKKATKSKATAIGNITVQKYKLGAVDRTINQRVVLTCDKNGNLK